MAIVDGHIRCAGCHEMRPVDVYPPSAKERGFGSCSSCATKASAARRRDPVKRTADNVKWRAWYQRNRTKHLERTARYYRANVERAADAHLRRSYGISIEQYDAMLAAQGGGCALCGKRQSTEKLKLAVDHDHGTGHVRGILCHHCNRAIGTLGDTTDGLRRALKYLEDARTRSPEPARTPSIRINLLNGAN